MTDFLLDDDGDLLIKKGDFVIGFSDNQHQEHILVAEKGEYKEFPAVGVGINQILNNEDYMPVLIEIKKQLQYDGMKVKNVGFEDQSITSWTRMNTIINIDGNY